MERPCVNILLEDDSNVVLLVSQPQWAAGCAPGSAVDQLRLALIDIYSKGFRLANSAEATVEQALPVSVWEFKRTAE